MTPGDSSPSSTNSSTTSTAHGCTAPSTCDKPDTRETETPMGSGIWSTDVYTAAKRLRAVSGASAFAYSDGGARTVHADLDPHGVTARESRDSDEHPASLAVAVLFDVTGSMGDVPRTLQTKLPDLLGLLLRKGTPPTRRSCSARSATPPATGRRCRWGSSSLTTAWTGTSATSCWRAEAAGR
nr:hypothetical protein GCM10020093_067410 [Planobispora longispora]